MRPANLITAASIIAILLVWCGDGAAQPQNNAPSEGNVTCPPDVKGEPPTLGRSDSKPLSDKLADSKGVICPPTGIDQDMQVRPPSGGQLKVIPPPGSPGGDQDVDPK
jgi:hypothetical protein